MINKKTQKSSLANSNVQMENFNKEIIGFFLNDQKMVKKILNSPSKKIQRQLKAQKLN